MPTPQRSALEMAYFEGYSHSEIAEKTGEPPGTVKTRIRAGFMLFPGCGSEMTVHEQFAEDLALLALGALDGDAKLSLEKHLEECASCRRELEQLRGDAALFALSTAGPWPPARAKARLMDPSRRSPGSPRERPRIPWWAALGWMAATGIWCFCRRVAPEPSPEFNRAELSGMVERERVAS